MNTSPTSEHLKREIGAGSLALACVNVMVGSGIFVLPALVAEGLGATAILAYIACAVLVFLIALCFAEVGSNTTKSGGAYTYIEDAFGPWAGFLAGNLYLLGSISSDAAVANALADTLQYFFPLLRVDIYRILFIFFVFGGLTWLNISSVKNGVRFVVFASIGKLLPLVILIAIAVPHVETENLKWVISPTLDNIGSASLLLFFAFLGFETCLGNGGEIKNPRRTVPLGIFGGLIFVLILYVSIQLVTQGALGNNLSSHKDAPLAAVANLAWGKFGMVCIIAVTSISILGNLSGEMLSMPRILFAAARDGLMPKIFARIHPRFSTPHIAIIAYASIGFILAVSGGFRQLAVLASASLLLLYLGVALATIRLRKIQPAHTAKGFRVPGGMIIPLLAAAGVIWMLSNSSKPEVIGLSIFIAVFSMIYFAMLLVRKKRKG
ncbi:MAG: APC family permease [Rhizobacter sp.]|nr:APC family permease [Ferruginibacter sp.]